MLTRAPLLGLSFARIAFLMVQQVVDAVVGSALYQNTTRPQGNQDSTVDVIFPLGCDFQYENAATWFTNTDKLVHWLNVDGRVNAFYSSPSIYTEAKLEKGKTYSLNSYDVRPLHFREVSVLCYTLFSSDPYE